MFQIRLLSQAASERKPGKQLDDDFALQLTYTWQPTLPSHAKLVLGVGTASSYTSDMGVGAGAHGGCTAADLSTEAP